MTTTSTSAGISAFDFIVAYWTRPWGISLELLRRNIGLELIATNRADMIVLEPAKKS
jgi:hypothetical protein